MENANKTYDLKVEKIISKTPAEVFRALSEGRLFMNCSADQESMKIDFKVGGKYSIEFLNYNMKNKGEFLEIVPNEKVVFTWCQDYDSNPNPDTTVSIWLKNADGKTALTLTHTGFTDQENCDNHKGGWTGGLEDLSQEMINGKIRFMRKVPVSIERLFEFCKSEFKGDTTESVANKKLVVKINGTLITLELDTDDDDANTSWLGLTQEGLGNEDILKSERSKWEAKIKQFK